MDDAGLVQVKRGGNAIGGNNEGANDKAKSKVEIEIRVTRRREWREERGGCEFSPTVPLLCAPYPPSWVHFARNLEK